ncbi:MAG: hypothetical protein Tsb0013_00900 [Phycisphaerales bacterium]
MFRTISALAVLATAGAASAQQLDVLLEVDLSVPDQITITATDGLSAATITGSDGIGFYLDQIIDGTNSNEADALVSGNLVSAQNTSNDDPDLFHFSGNTGLNVFDVVATGDLNFVAGETAFSGSATWNISADFYATFAAVGSRGLVYFPADDDTDLTSASVLGEWVIVPAPGAGALLAMGGLVAVRRRRA